MQVRKRGSIMLMTLIMAGLYITAAVAQSPNSKGIWISNEEIAKLPTSGKAWEHLKSTADGSTGSPDVSDQDDDTNVKVMAKALVYARTGDESYRTDVINACMAAIGTERGGRTLALARELIGYVIAADLVGLPSDKDQQFRAWLRETLTENLSGKTLVSTHEDRPNNWGTHAGGSRVAVARYLGDQTELERCAQVFKGWLGDRSSYSDFSYGDLSWQADRSNPVGVNPAGAVKDGHSIDGALPDDMRRGGSFKWPPGETGYAWEGLQGALAQAEILHRAGYDAWNWENQALKRAAQFLDDIGWQAGSDDTWQPWLINYRYGTNFPAKLPSTPGKNVGWTDWTHGSSREDGGGTTGIEGKVENNATGSAVEGAAVQLKQGSTVRYEATSNSFGRYSFTDIAAGDYILFSAKSGYQDWTGNVTIQDKRQLFGQNIRLVPIGDSESPSPPANVRVTVAD